MPSLFFLLLQQRGVGGDGRTGVIESAIGEPQRDIAERRSTKPEKRNGVAERRWRGRCRIHPTSGSTTPNHVGDEECGAEQVFFRIISRIISRIVFRIIFRIISRITALQRIDYEPRRHTSFEDGGEQLYGEQTSNCFVHDTSFSPPILERDVFSQRAYRHLRPTKFRPRFYYALFQRFFLFVS